MNPVESRGDERSVVVFHVHKEKKIVENYQAAYELWRERNPTLSINVDAKLLLNQKNYILKAKGITAAKIDQIKENIIIKISNDADHTKGMNGGN